MPNVAQLPLPLLEAYTAMTGTKQPKSFDLSSFRYDPLKRGTNVVATRLDHDGRSDVKVGISCKPQDISAVGRSDFLLYLHAI